MGRAGAATEAGDKLRAYMNPAAHQIQEALQAVARLRRQHAEEPAMAQAGAKIKRFQARRFQATYADLLQSPRYKTTAHFFLHELYSDRDYAQRDEQFERIAGTVAKLFPQAVVDTAAALAQVHALTEQLDDLMARQWLESYAGSFSMHACARYIHCWRRVADPKTRHKQLEVVLKLGRELDRMTRMPGLRTLLRLMRGPAAVGGLSSLQGFLEAGFDAFAAMRGAEDFLQVLEQRETKWIKSLFEDEALACETALAQLIGPDTSR